LKKSFAYKLVGKDDKMAKKYEDKKEDTLKEQEPTTDQNGWKEKFIRASADLENYQRRISKERAVWVEQAQADVFLDLLAVVDDFDRAMEHHAKQDSEESKALIKGFEMIHQAFYKLLEKYDIKEISEVQTFNPEQHEAMTQVDSPDHDSGDIVQVLQKGFLIKERVLRPSMVAVAK
jgi:molecular chaperone GrpE